MKSKMKSLERADTLAFFAFAAPWILGFVFLTLIPMAASFVMSFSQWNILSPPVWNGADNYRDIFTDPLFYKSVQVTLLYTLFSVPLNIVASIFVAILLNNNLPGMRVFRTLFYLPAIISGVVVALLWLWIYNPDYGIINSVLRLVGIQGPQWVYGQDWALPSLVAMSLWSIGGNMVLYLAGIQSISTELYEAASIDGAGFWARFVKVTLPGISPVILFTLLTGIIGALQTFTQAFVMTEGGPNNATFFYAYYIYNNAFRFRKMGVACAQAWVLFAIIFAITMVSLRVTKGMVHYDSKEGGEIL